MFKMRLLSYHRDWKVQQFKKFKFVSEKKLLLDNTTEWKTVCWIIQRYLVLIHFLIHWHSGPPGSKQPFEDSVFFFKTVQFRPAWAVFKKKRSVSERYGSGRSWMPAGQTVSQTYLWTLYIHSWNTLNVRFSDFWRLVGNDWSDSIRKDRPILTHLIGIPFFPFGVKQNHFRKSRYATSFQHALLWKRFQWSWRWRRL